jgi:hypothetical protein
MSTSFEQVFEQRAEPAGAASGAGSTVALLAEERFDNRASRSTALSRRCDDATGVVGVGRGIAGSHGAGRCPATRGARGSALAEDLPSQDDTRERFASLSSPCAQIHRRTRSSERTRATRGHTTPRPPGSMLALRTPRLTAAKQETACKPSDFSEVPDYRRHG